MDQGPVWACGKRSRKQGVTGGGCTGGRTGGGQAASGRAVGCGGLLRSVLARTGIRALRDAAFNTLPRRALKVGTRLMCARRQVLSSLRHRRASQRANGRASGGRPGSALVASSYMSALGGCAHWAAGRRMHGRTGGRTGGGRRRVGEQSVVADSRAPCLRGQGFESSKIRLSTRCHASRLRLGRAFALKAGNRPRA